MKGNNDESTKGQQWKLVQGATEQKSDVGKILMVLFVFMVAVGALVWVISSGVKRDQANQHKEDPNNIASSGVTEELGTADELVATEDEQASEENTAIVLTLDQVNELVHKMANSIIIAGDNEIWGKESITKEKIKDVLQSTKGIDDYLYAEMTKWQNLDFSNGVDVHNYVWRKLDGSVGSATSLNDYEIENIKRQLEG